MEISLASADSLEELDTKLRANCKELAFDVDAFMELAWPRAMNKFLAINDDV
jgi:hypothetical protein